MDLGGYRQGGESCGEEGREVLKNAAGKTKCHGLMRGYQERWIGC